MTKNLKYDLLYVDDEPINLIIFEASFSKLYDVITCETGQKGLEILEQNPNISIVISDMNMPKMNGIEFIKAAKKKHHNIAFFILTGYELNNEISEALKEKLIFQYFSKPFNITKIEAAIQNALK